MHACMVIFILISFSFFFFFLKVTIRAVVRKMKNAEKLKGIPDIEVGAPMISAIQTS